ncbi:MAG: PAS domain S-box protein [Desulfohalobiaceae bacterium]|nr:PAS domain S-box protein [Desulfohalobiaceae bacterium]
MTHEPTYYQLLLRVNRLEKEQKEQRRIEEELVKRQKYLESVIHHAPDAIVTLDSSHRVLQWNPGAESIFGYTCEEVLGRDLDDLISRADVIQEARDVTRLVMSGNTLPPLETVRYTRDGTPVQVIVSGSPITLDGVLQGVVAVYTDITRRKDMEKALEKSEQIYRAIFENTGSATFIAEEDTTILLANKEFVKLSGYSKQELEGRRSWKDFVADEKELQKMERYHCLRKQDPRLAPTNYECRIRDKQGLIKDTVITVDMIPGSTQSVASFLDISEHKRLQESLRQERDSLDNILENSADAIVIVDARGRFTRWNRRASELFGYHHEEMLSRKAFDFYSDQKEMDRMLEKLRRASFVRNYEISYQRKDGTAVPCSLSINLLKDKESRVIGSVSIIRDLTEWKKAEERLNYMSFHDSLTELYNRNYFEEEMKRLQDGRHAPLGIIVCDVDGLKSINDTLGHEHGDDLLVNTASILRSNFRASDIIARIGGDEFSILIPQTSHKDMEKLVQRLRTYVEKFNNSGSKIPISLSIGYAVCEEQPADMQEIFRKADQMMYREKMQRDKSSRSDVLQVLMKSLEARDFITEGHCDRLQELILPLARSRSLSEETINDLLLLAKVHDLGKLGVPDSILFKPGRLTADEAREMRKHCEIGQRIATAVSDLAPIADWILKHHEWWNGRGYPLGLKGEEIPLPCRMLALADAYDAMISHRPYRKAVPRDEAVAELRRNAGTQFDPELTEKFIHILTGETQSRPESITGLTPP